MTTGSSFVELEKHCSCTCCRRNCCKLAELLWLLPSPVHSTCAHLLAIWVSVCSNAPLHIFEFFYICMQVAAAAEALSALRMQSAKCGRGMKLLILVHCVCARHVCVGVCALLRCAALVCTLLYCRVWLHRFVLSVSKLFVRAGLTSDLFWPL